jgi:hypothetical protein
VSILMLISLGMVIAVRADDKLPIGFNVNRYQKVWERNPFTLVTPVIQQAQPTLFDKLVLVSWLKDGSRDVVLVQNSETNEVQKVTKEANMNNLQLIEIRRNQNPQMVEAVLSNGVEQGSVKFKLDVGAGVQPPAGQASLPVPNGVPVSAQAPQPDSSQMLNQPPIQGPQGDIQGQPTPAQALQQQAQQNANQMIQTPPSQPGQTPMRSGEIRRKQLMPPASN